MKFESDWGFSATETGRIALARCLQPNRTCKAHKRSCRISCVRVNASMLNLAINGEVYSDGLAAASRCLDAGYGDRLGLVFTLLAKPIDFVS